MDQLCKVVLRSYILKHRVRMDSGQTRVGVVIYSNDAETFVGLDEFEDR